MVDKLGSSTALGGSVPAPSGKPGEMNIVIHESQTRSAASSSISNLSNKVVSRITDLPLGDFLTAGTKTRRV
jgi:hypothetical protein